MSVWQVMMKRYILGITFTLCLPLHVLQPLTLICFFSCRMLLNQPMQTLVPTSVSSQPSQCNMGISPSMWVLSLCRRLYLWRHVILCLTFSSCATYRYTLEQQILAPSFPMQQVNCNAVLVPSPVFTSPIMIPHNSFITHQSQSAYHSQPQASQHSLQLQQPQQFFQVCCSNMSQHVVLSLLHRFLD